MMFLSDRSRSDRSGLRLKARWRLVRRRLDRFAAFKRFMEWKNQRRAGDPKALSPISGEFIIAVVFGLVFVVGGAWAFLAEIEGAVIASGAVSPESGIKTVQHPEGGIVAEIRVREGDRVQAGQVLMVLKADELRANLAMVETQYFATLAEIARLEAERDGRTRLRFPRELIRAAVTNASARNAMETQRRLFESRRKLNVTQKKVLEQQINALEKQLEGLKAELEGKKRQAALIREEINTVSRLLAKGQALKPRLLALQRTAAALKGDMGRNLGEQAKTREYIAQIRQQIVSIDRDFLAGVLDRLAELQQQESLLREKRIDLARKLELTRMRAPADGRVLEITMKTIGGVIGPREPVIRIVPLKEALIIQAKVQPTDIDELRPDQLARVVFSAFEARTTPTLNGTVRTISPAPLIDEADSQPYYRVDVEVPAAELGKLPKGAKLVPGMPAEVFITTRPRTPMDIILKPLKDSMRRAMRSD